MNRVLCWILGHDWHLVRPVNAKTFNFWNCVRCGQRIDEP